MFICREQLNIMVYQVLQILLFATDYFRFAILDGIFSQIFQRHLPFFKCFSFCAVKTSAGILLLLVIIFIVVNMLSDLLSEAVK